MSRTAGVALAVTALVCGTTIPAIGLVQSGAAVSSSAAAADIRAQSFTANAEVLPDVSIRGSYTATTPDELEEIQAVAAATARSGIAPIAKPGQVIIPMSAGSYTMTDGFGESRPGRSHMGQDYAASVGTPIYAAADGVVSMSQESYGGYGVTVQIEHDLGGGASAISTLYGHMDYGTRAVEVGERVTAGQYLGNVGSTGYIFGSCLHFEVHVNGAPIDPLPWLEANVR
ncbi:M23 family metallopeptidase [Microbacterium resistens]|uniref:M23 family metallopeptidase n=1 Tax=Microbacterium resistens TaxID=156977 RepID=A0ABY3RZY1_9MICO|nr:M23 family metallopeptidase [Microbacterium resistens]UGS28481.1 M23 family metallopeptidase [Microbacterium resistens]